MKDISLLLSSFPLRSLGAGTWPDSSSLHRRPRGSARCTPDGYGRAAVSQRECLCVLARDLPFFDKETGSPWHGCGFVPPPFTLPLASSVLFARPKLLSLLPKIQEREVMLGNAVLRVPLSLSLTRNNKEAEWKGEGEKKGCWWPSGV